MIPWPMQVLPIRASCPMRDRPMPDLPPADKTKEGRKPEAARRVSYATSQATRPNVFRVEHVILHEEIKIAPRVPIFKIQKIAAMDSP